MSLTPGTRLGPYEIVAVLGAGGMGEVYRARDDRLDRFVAIKVLSAAVAATPERLERFRREARAVAALNHPHICAIYDIGTGDAASPAYIAMELLEGETLHSRLRRGPLSLSESVEVGTALAEALESAHAKGLVHRDMKPENIMLTAQGPKILDFGLAKPAQATVSANEPTRSSDARLTGTGATVGTPAYMSPEQLRGEQLDARSDLFAFGLVLYEMATGRPAFTGATAAAVSAAILYDSPPAPRSIRPELPVHLEDTILKALEKDRTLRCQSASELRADFKRLSRTLGTATPPPTEISIPQAPAAQRQPSLSHSGTAGGGPSSDVQIATDLIKRHRRGVALTTLALVAVVVVVIALLPSADRDAIAPEAIPAVNQAAELSLQNAEIVRLTTSGNADLPAISPDGRYVAYVQRDGEDESLWIRQTATASNVRIVPAQRGVQIDAPTVTPDGNYVDYIAITRSPRVAYTLLRVPFLGGTPRRLADDVYSGVAWSPDGKSMAFVRLTEARGKTNLVVADYEGRNERVLVARQMPDEAAFFTLNNPTGPGTRLAWSPDGSVIAGKGIGMPRGVLTGYAMLVAAVDGGVRTELPQTPPGDLAWIDGSSLLQARSINQGAMSQLWRIAYPSGEVTRLTNDLDGYLRTSLVTKDGRFAAVRAEERIEIWIGDSAGNGRDVVSGARHAYGTVAANVVTWAGDRLLYTAGSANDLALFAIDPDGGTAEEIVPMAAGSAAAVDGRSIVYLSQAEATLGWIFKADADGRQPTSLVREVAAWARLSRDGRVLYATQSRTWVVPIDGGAPAQVTDIDTRAPDVSPDGRQLAFVSLNAASELEIVVCDLPACDAPRRFAPAGLRDPMLRGSTVRFTPDGTAVGYASFAGQPNVWVQPLDGSAPRQLTTFTDGREVYDFAWSADGERLAVAHGSFSTDIVLFSGFGASQER